MPLDFQMASPAARRRSMMWPDPHLPRTLADVLVKTGFTPTQDEARAWADDLRGLGESYFFSLNRYLFVASAL